MGGSAVIMPKYKKRGVMHIMYTAKPFAVAICDDAVQDAKILEKIIKQIITECRIVKYTRGDQLLKDLKDQACQYDAVFLAICMKEKNGIETGEELRKIDEKLPIIFTSVSDEFYREAFDLYAFQYLLKPVTYMKVKAVLDHMGALEEPSVYFRYRARIYTVKHSEIKYISSSLHTVNFHLINGNTLHCRGKLGDFEEQLQGSSIIRCHQSFFVNLNSIIGMKSSNFILDDTAIPISRTYVKNVQSRYLEHLKKENR